MSYINIATNIQHGKCNIMFTYFILYTNTSNNPYIVITLLPITTVCLKCSFCQDLSPCQVLQNLLEVYANYGRIIFNSNTLFYIKMLVVVVSGARMETVLLRSHDWVGLLLTWIQFNHFINVNKLQQEEKVLAFGLD